MRSPDSGKRREVKKQMEAGKSRKNRLLNASKELSAERMKTHHILPEKEYTQTIRKRNRTA